jgi:hypothetical protein
MRTIEWGMVIAALGLSLGACGGEVGKDADVSRFMGTWNATSGTMTLTCPGETDTWSVTGTVKWDKGLASDLVQATPPCIVDVDVRGSTAAGMGPTCSFSDQVGGTYTMTTPNYTFVLAPDGRTAQENASGTLVDSNGGASVSCTFSETASYTKLGD